MDPHAHNTHPVVACAEVLSRALDEVAGVDPLYMATPEKQAALTTLTRVASRVEELRLRVLAGAGDVAAQTAARDAADWLTHACRLDGGQARRDLRLARALDARWHRLAAGLADGSVNRAQAGVIAHALADLPDDLDPDILAEAEEHLVGLAGEFGPRQLRILARRVLQVIAPEVAEDAERKALEGEEAAAHRRTFLTTRRNGDGTTDLRIRLADAAANRLLCYLEAFTSPRRTPNPGPPGQPGQPGEPVTDDRRSYDQKLGHAFVAFLESTDPDRMPLHGGDATTLIVTLDLTDLLADLHEDAGIAWVGDEPITAAHARRLACTARIIPAVLGADSEILDLGRARRLFTPAQRKAMAIRDITCRAQGCEIPAAWCEAHHAHQPWATGGKTNLADGLLLCSWHHHRAHDHRYNTRQHPDGTIRFTRRT